MPKVVECTDYAGKGCVYCLYTGKAIDWSEEDSED